MSGVNKVLRAGRSLQSDHTPSTFSSSSFGARPSFGIPTRGAKMAPREAKSHFLLLQQNIVVAPEGDRVKKTTGMNEHFSAAIKLLVLQLQTQSGRTTTRRISWTSRAQMILERGVVGCRSFAMIAIAGSLLGSILCFVELHKCWIVEESYNYSSKQ